jgi:hypothetical protein
MTLFTTPGAVIGIAVALEVFDHRTYQAKYKQLDGPYWEVDVDAEKFFNAITVAKANNAYGAFVHAYSKEEYNSMKLFLLNNGSKKGVAGIAVKENGDVVSVFKHPDCKIDRVATKLLLPKAIENGGNRLDCFNGMLPGIYAQIGFAPVAKVRFSESEAPSDWNYERDGKPDIIFMELKKDLSTTTHEQVDAKTLALRTLDDIARLPHSS